MQWTANDLDGLVEQCDQAGGIGTPACDALLADFSYLPSYQVNQNLDPFSEDYVAEQMTLYEELAGHAYAAQRNELLDFDIMRHIAAVNPYDHPDPCALATHLQRLSRALRLAAPRRGERLLDMGCGWGLSSELCAYLGLDVTAVDINPGFVRLVGERAKVGRRQITAAQGRFEDFVPTTPVDLVLFYECLHHAVRPWAVIRHLASHLRTGGRVVMTGEPIQANWWSSWGLRLDAFSIYCIRKHGWFESGWTLSFIMACLERSGLAARFHPDPDHLFGDVIVAEKLRAFEVQGGNVDILSDMRGAELENGWLVLTGKGGLNLAFPEGVQAAVLSLSNFRGKPISVKLSSGGVVLFDALLLPDGCEVRVERRGCVARLDFEVEGWSPAKELGNGDERTIGLHIGKIVLA